MYGTVYKWWGNVEIGSLTNRYPSCFIKVGARSTLTLFFCECMNFTTTYTFKLLVSAINKSSNLLNVVNSFYVRQKDLVYVSYKFDLNNINNLHDQIILSPLYYILQLKFNLFVTCFDCQLKCSSLSSVFQ